VLSVILGDGRWVELTVPVDPLYLTVLVAAEKKFWRCVQTGEPPRLINVPAPAPRVDAVRLVDMSASGSWAGLARIFRATEAACRAHQRAQRELQTMLPEEAEEAIGHGVRVTRVSVEAIRLGGVPAAADPMSAAAETYPPTAAAAPSAYAEPCVPDDPAPAGDDRSPHRLPAGHVPSRGIDKSVLALPAPRRYRAPEHLRLVAQQPCLICGRKPSDPHHLRFAQPRALGRKASDEFTVPLCRIHHRLVHHAGDERGWWVQAGIDPTPIARELWAATARGHALDPEPASGQEPGSPHEPASPVAAGSP
jgi:hypothetical protein